MSKAAEDVTTELAGARAKFAPFNSAHEGFAVLKEEVDELWREVCAKKSPERTTRMRAEAVQVAAMALRFIEDVCDRSTGSVGSVVIQAVRDLHPGIDI